MNTLAEPTIYTVSRLNSTARIVLEQEIGTIWLNGEISNLVQHSSGHWYFTLKDSHAQIRAAMFKGQNRRVTFRPQSGQQVLVQGQLSLYEARGDYQLIVDRMQPAGEGMLQLRYAALKEQLTREGLFAPEQKRPLPEAITTVGVITSPTGAAIHDILSVLKRRDPGLRVILYPSSVQGEAAVPELLKAIATASQRDECDVLIIGRGGGSLEDLWCFNDERVIRALVQIPMPTISAVGHEVDVTLSDYAADVRAPTPSAAAEIVSRDRRAQQQQWQSLWTRLQASMRATIQRQALLYQRLDNRLQQRNPRIQLQQKMQRADELSFRLQRSMQNLTRTQQQQWQQLQQRLMQQSPAIQLAHQQQKQSYLQQRLFQAMTRLQQRKQLQWQELGRQLHLLSPLNILARGYSVTLDAHERPVTDATQVKAGDPLKIRLYQGELQVTTDSIQSDHD